MLLKNLAKVEKTILWPNSYKVSGSKSPGQQSILLGGNSKLSNNKKSKTIKISTVNLRKIIHTRSLAELG